MDYNEEPNSKIPFYMTYPMQNLYLTEMEYEKDMERIQELYPQEVKRLLECIKDRCDELEFEGSRMFDENPDRMMMEKEVLDLYRKISEEENGMPNPPDAAGVQQEDAMPERMSGGETEEADLDSDIDRSMMKNGLPNPQMMPDRMPESQMNAMGLGKSIFALFPPEGQMLPGTEAEEKKEPLLMAQSQESCDGWLCSMIGVLFGNEVYKRRCRHRRCHRWW